MFRITLPKPLGFKTLSVEYDAVVMVTHLIRRLSNWIQKLHRERERFFYMSRVFHMSAGVRRAFYIFMCCLLRLPPENDNPDGGN
jgi:hypothetical protein